MKILEKHDSSKGLPKLQLVSHSTKKTFNLKILSCKPKSNPAKRMYRHFFEWYKACNKVPSLKSSSHELLWVWQVKVIITKCFSSNLRQIVQKNNEQSQTFNCSKNHHHQMMKIKIVGEKFYLQSPQKLIKRKRCQIRIWFGHWIHFDFFHTNGWWDFGETFFSFDG